MSDNLIIRKASREEFAIAVEWAANEGWNPGVDDLDAFYDADPDGFIMGWLGPKPVSSISVVRYGNSFGFLGFYIVHKEHRGTGVGIKTWNAGMEHLKGRTVALDGVVEQQANYMKSGFSYVGANIRFSGVPNRNLAPVMNLVVRALESHDLPQIWALDRQCFYAAREKFIQNWCLPGPAVKRNSVVAVADDQVAGFGAIRKCREGYKIGPLFAKDKSAAEALLSALLGGIEPASTVVLDVPEINSDAVDIAQALGLEAVFETARMVCGSAGQISWDFVYGISSFELG